MTRIPSPRRAAVAAALLLAAGAARAEPLPLPPLPAATPAPAAAPYDPKADAGAEIEAAFRQARSDHRDVLLDFGANWCPDCRVLAGVLRAPGIAPWVSAHFVPVMVDVGRIDRNLDYAARYGVRVGAIPTVLVVRPDGTLLDPDGTRTLDDARAMSSGAMVALLAEWGGRARPPD